MSDFAINLISNAITDKFVPPSDLIQRFRLDHIQSALLLNLVNLAKPESVLPASSSGRVTMAGRVGRFVIRKDGDAPKNLFDNEEQTSNPALAERTRRANPLYAKVPATRLEAKPESNVSGLTGLAMSLAARHPLQSDSDPGSVSGISDRHNITDL